MRAPGATFASPGMPFAALGALFFTLGTLFFCPGSDRSVARSAVFLPRESDFVARESHNVGQASRDAATIYGSFARRRVIFAPSDFSFDPRHRSLRPHCGDVAPGKAIGSRVPIMKLLFLGHPEGASATEAPRRFQADARIVRGLQGCFPQPAARSKEIRPSVVERGCWDRNPAARSL